MRGSFFGLNVAVNGLYAAQRNLDVINHNINNVNTPGFSRQQAVQTAWRPISLYDGTGMVGAGADITAIKRIRDEFLDYKYWSESISNGEWSAKRDVLAEVEATFNEPSPNEKTGSGFTMVMKEFYNSLQELSKDPGSPSMRANVRECGVTLAKYFNTTATHFEKLQDDVNNRIRSKVEQVNSLATQIGQLNRQIYVSELDGNTANDLRDQRTVLVDQLSKLINIQASEVVNGKLPNGKDNVSFIVTVSGKALVDHFDVNKLDMVQRQTKKNPDEDIPSLYDVMWADGNSLEIKGGELKGYLDVRDGNNGMNGSPDTKGLPYYIRKLNEFVRTFARAFNEGFIDANGDGDVADTGDANLPGHVNGYGKNGNQYYRFFTMLGTDNKAIDSTTFINGADETVPQEIFDCYKTITAKNFAVSDDIMKDLNKIATADNPGEASNANIINGLIDMRHNPNMFATGSPEDFMKSLISNLGIDSQQAIRLSDNQNRIVKQIENERVSVSGVSQDEEMANLVKYQHSYNACAKMISTMQEVYDTLINKLGVG